MGRYHAYLQSAAGIISLYKGEEPFATYLKKYFAAHKQFGSTDRKQVGQLCYAYFRTGRLLAERTAAEKILAGLFLCSQEPHRVLETMRPEWNRETGTTWREKLTLIGEPARVEELFPFAAELSTGIDRELFAVSHLQQPAVFLRIRPGQVKIVIKKLNDAGILYTGTSNSCLQLPAGVKLDDLLQIDREAVIQDYSSQRLGEFMQRVPEPCRQRLWDVCAASGGKSILARDIFGPVNITVTDIRESILVNLRKRFRSAGILDYQAAVADLSRPGSFRPAQNFSCLLADVPCSGSGTWGRTPEQLLYFTENKIEEYASLQRSLVSNALPYLQPGGYLLYSTCSVFREENEEVVAYLRQAFRLELVHEEALAGYERKADTMYAALLRKKE